MLYFRVSLLKIFQPNIPKFCQNLSFSYSIFAYDTLICLTEVTPKRSTASNFDSFLYLFYTKLS